MSKPLASLVLAVALTGSFAACSQSVSEEEVAASVAAAKAAVPAGTRLVAATVYADWCGSCKILDPKVADVAAASGDQPVAFVKLDYTAKDKDAFYATADAAGIGEAVRAELSDGIKTGQLLLIDLDDKKVVKVIKKDATASAIAAAIASAAVEA